MDLILIIFGSFFLGVHFGPLVGLAAFCFAIALALQLPD